MDISTKEITLKKSKWKQGGFFDHRNYIEKVRRNDVDFSTLETTSKKVRGNDVDFSTIEITSKKVPENRDVVCPLGGSMKTKPSKIKIFLWKSIPTIHSYTITKIIYYYQKAKKS